MRAANDVVSSVLTKLSEQAEPGISTIELDRIAEQYIRDHGATPAFKGYQGYPNTITTSVNEQVVHGIPSEDQILQNADLLSIDVGACKQQAYGDSALTIQVGDQTPQAQQLMDVTRSSLYEAIDCVRAGNRLGQVSSSVEGFVRPHGFGIVKDWSGHFIGHEMHLDPKIPNYGPVDRGPVLQPGVFLAIEPMVTLGEPETAMLEDGWTVKTEDGSLSAHFEHTVAVTDNGPEVLSRRWNEVLD